jgi:ketol-acid reductoisomerase
VSRRAGCRPAIADYARNTEPKLIVDLVCEGGFTHVRRSISDVAEYGDLTRGRVGADDQVRPTMRHLLEDVRNGSFAREPLAEGRLGTEAHVGR